MINLPDIEVCAQIYSSASSLVYRGIRQSDNTPIILKVLKEDYPTTAALIRSKQEYAITRSLDLEGVIKVYSQQDYQRSLVMTLEDFGGESLEKLRQDSPESYYPIPLAEFLHLAIKLAEIIGLIHAAQIIHRDINPSNIVLNPATGTVKIIDFGIATRFSRTNPSFQNPHVLEGTLAYISPEQTGRMNRILDYRTDFYSLGVTYYELLTGELPFVTDDVLELVHCHIAGQPIAPNDLNSEIPPTVSEIILKLMAKNAEDRYQSATGIKADLETCLLLLDTTNQIESFPLGMQDISDRFQIPQKLYGREAEIEMLLAAFERVAGEAKKQGSHPISQIELMLVAGYSGIGKSALVQEIYKPVTKKRGYFISGKFDQFGRNIPYSAVVSAFQSLMRQILAESETTLQQWRDQILVVVGAIAQVIIDVIPEVELIIGAQSSVPEVGAIEAQNRFNLVFQKFIRVFCSPKHPLVIFLDDLQWVDSATLKLIELMMTDYETQSLLLIGAYRDNEVDATHPLMLLLNQLRSRSIAVNQIALAPLELKDTCQLIAETLHRDSTSIGPLAELVQRKTGGNPFFVEQFLKTLYTENLIEWVGRDSSGNHGGWQWNLAQIEAQNFTDNVVELMICKLKKLPKTTQQVLKLAACIGAEFSLDILAIVCDKSAIELFRTLLETVQAGAILPISEFDENLLIQDYKFLHDRVSSSSTQHQRFNLRSPGGTTDSTIASVDLAAVMKAAGALSEEIQLDRLISTLMQVAIENAGAQKGSLMLLEDEELSIVAQCVGTKHCKLERIPIANYPDIPIAIIQYVERTQEPLVLDNAAIEPTFAADPYIQQQQPRSLLCIPIIKQSKPIGILYLENNLSTGAFTSDRLEVLQLLIAQAAISLENARLYERLEDYSETLELKVEERTQALQQALQQERSLKQRIEKMAAIEERNRIAREIHDSLGHSLTALNVQLQAAASLLISDPTQAQSFLTQAQRLGKTAMQEVRQSVRTLRSDEQAEQPLEETIATLAEEFRQVTGITPTVHTHLMKPISISISKTIYRIVQEALTNISKYAQATQVKIQLVTIGDSLRDGKAEGVCLEIKDNGKGFNCDRETTGFGLKGMQERIAALDGEFHLTTAPGSGCKIQVKISLSKST